MPRVKVIHRDLMLKAFGKPVSRMSEDNKARTAARLRQEHGLNVYRIGGTRALCYSDEQVGRIVEKITVEIRPAA